MPPGRPDDVFAAVRLISNDFFIIKHEKNEKEEMYIGWRAIAMPMNTCMNECFLHSPAAMTSG